MNLEFLLNYGPKNPDIHPQCPGKTSTCYLELEVESGIEFLGKITFLQPKFATRKFGMSDAVFYCEVLKYYKKS